MPFSFSSYLPRILFETVDYLYFFNSLIIIDVSNNHFNFLCSLPCRLTFETALKLRGGPSLVFAHSMGNNVFRYFLEWLKLEIAPKRYIEWLDEHIHAYFAVGVLTFLSYVFST